MGPGVFSRCAAVAVDGGGGGARGCLWCCLVVVGAFGCGTCVPAPRVLCVGPMCGPPHFCAKFVPSRGAESVPAAEGNVPAFQTVAIGGC
jgi:hypothetical protein